MLTWLAQYQDVWGPLRLFEYLTFRAVGAAGTALVLGWLIGPWLIRTLRSNEMKQVFRTKEEVRELADLHAGKKNTPTMGGFLIYLSVLLSTLLWAKPNVWVMTTLGVYTALTLLGFSDDYLKISKKNSKGLAGRYKLIVQALVVTATLAVLMNHPDSAEKVREIWLPFVKDPILENASIWVLFPFLFLVLAGSSNAINLTDGLDGLAIGCTICAALAYALMAYAAGNALVSGYLLISFVPGTGELSVICATMVGAGLAFLWFNAHPAEIFMGDTGSLALGGLIGMIAFLVHQPFTLVIVGGIFVIEALSVFIQVGSFKLRKGKRVFRMAPIHHHFERLGWAETKVVIRFWILSLIFAIAGLATLKIR
jgi:phospho-N-acetylmuramoyl-pentapeptide-transferase